MITFAMFVKMSNGATYAVVPFINRRALGAVSGIVGAGGNAGAVALGLLVQERGDRLAHGAVHRRRGGDVHFVRQLRDHRAAAGRDRRPPHAGASTELVAG